MITNTYHKVDNPPIFIVDIKGKKHKGNFKFWADLEDEILIRNHTWNMNKLKYLTCNCHGILLHRLIMEAKEGEEVDHVDHHPENNCRNNLRISTHQQNMMNRKVSYHRDIPVKGVYLNGQSWCVEIEKDGYRRRKRGFKTLHEAICYRVRKEYELYGEFSYNYRGILKKIPKILLDTYFPEIYSDRNFLFIGSEIHKAHFKNKKYKDFDKQLRAIQKAGI